MATKRSSAIAVCCLAALAVLVQPALAGRTSLAMRRYFPLFTVCPINGETETQHRLLPDLEFVANSRSALLTVALGPNVVFADPSSSAEINTLIIVRDDVFHQHQFCPAGADAQAPSGCVGPSPDNCFFDPGPQAWRVLDLDAINATTPGVGLYERFGDPCPTRWTLVGGAIYRGRIANQPGAIVLKTPSDAASIKVTGLEIGATYVITGSWNWFASDIDVNDPEASRVNFTLDELPDDVPLDLCGLGVLTIADLRTQVAALPAPDPKPPKKPGLSATKRRQLDGYLAAADLARAGAQFIEARRRLADFATAVGKLQVGSRPQIAPAAAARHVCAAFHLGENLGGP